MPQKCIFLVYPEQKFRKVRRTFLTLSRQPLNRFSSNLTSNCQIVSLKTESPIFVFFSPFSNNRHFSKRSADDSSPLTLSYCQERTNARVKNLRHLFFSRTCQEANAMFIVLFRLFLAYKPQKTIKSLFPRPKEQEDSDRRNQA